MRTPKYVRCLSSVAGFMLGAAGAAFAASNDEIQVYDDAINKPGELGLDVHMNYVASGIKTPQWPGDSPSDHSFRVTPEFNYGLTETWEAGAYLPFLMEANGAKHLEGAKVRIKYLSAPKDSAFYWGANEELGRVSLRSAEDYWNLEVRPIFGYRIAKWHFTLNPVLGFSLSGPNRTGPDFSPAFRIRYEPRENLAFGLEHYAGLGNPFSPSAYDQTHVTFVVVDSEVAGHAVNFGVGKGANANSDKWTVKAIIGTRFD